MMNKMSSTLGKILTLFLISLLISSCQDDQGEDNTGITLSSFAGTDLTVKTKALFIVKDAQKKNVTSEAEIFIGNNKISENSYTFSEVGVYEVYASYKDFKSNKLTINVTDEAPTSTLSEFTPKVLVHEFTGTSCGHCVREIFKIKDKIKKFPGEVIPIEIHSNGSGNAYEGKESFDFPNNEVFGVNSFPTVWYNNDKVKNEFSDEEVKEYLSNKTKTGLAINYSLEDEEITVKIISDSPINDKKIVAFLLEGNLLSDQANYYNDDKSSPAYKKGKVIKDMEYENVARAALTQSPFGDVITDATGNQHTIVFSLTDKTDMVKDLNYSKVVVFLLDKNDNYINAQVAVANQNSYFD